MRGAAVETKPERHAGLGIGQDHLQLRPAMFPALAQLVEKSIWAFAYPQIGCWSSHCGVVHILASEPLHVSGVFWLPGFNACLQWTVAHQHCEIAECLAVLRLQCGACSATT